MILFVGRVEIKSETSINLYENVYPGKKKGSVKISPNHLDFDALGSHIIVMNASLLAPVM